MTNAYPWPCHRRIAHGPHPVTRWEDDGPGLMAPYARTCPGVPAHPDTMIGRQPPTPVEWHDDPHPALPGIDLTTLNKMPPCPAHDPASTTPKTDLP